MIKLLDILKEIDGIPQNGLEKVKERLDSAMFNWDKSQKQLAVTVLKNFGYKQGDYNKLEYSDKKEYIAKILANIEESKLKNILNTIVLDRGSSFAVRYAADSLLKLINGIR